MGLCRLLFALHERAHPGNFFVKNTHKSTLRRLALTAYLLNFADSATSRHYALYDVNIRLLVFKEHTASNAYLLTPTRLVVDR